MQCAQTCTCRFFFFKALLSFGSSYTRTCTCTCTYAYHYSKKLKEHVDIMIFIEHYPLKSSKVNCFLNITDLNEVQLSSNSWT